MSDCKEEKGLTSCEEKVWNETKQLKCSWLPEETFEVGKSVVWFEPDKNGNKMQKKRGQLQ